VYKEIAELTRDAIAALGQEEKIHRAEFGAQPSSS
jgi:hypothetical protein